ncbi:MAG: glycosyltransferase family 2 protein [Verrucomicrobiales bacterium]|nr:glycosyltransferase family 2 protein [Verrucomicrobiae bacterium]
MASILTQPARRNVQVPVPTTELPRVTVIVPCYNEEDNLEKNTARLLEYLETITARYDWEVLFINDGSKDNTGPVLDRIATRDTRLRVVHHLRNRGLAEGLRTGFANARGDYAVTVDADLSYAPEHIGAMLDKILETRAEIVLASPYMKGGRTSNVPWSREMLSRWANRFLSRISPQHFSTFTGMVRAYDMHFLRSLDLKAGGMDIMPEIIYKTLLLRGRVEEIPAHLDWSELIDPEKPRRISFGLSWHTFAILFSGFLFRPFLFFLVPGALLMLLSLTLSAFVLVHVGVHYQELAPGGGNWKHFKDALDSSWHDHGYAFAGTATLLILSVQLLSLGVLSMQSKRYFEEIFHLGTSVYRRSQRDD